MLDIQAELQQQGQYPDLYEAVVELKRRHDLHPCVVHARDGLSLRSDGDREQVQDLVSRFRRIPEGTRRNLPALLNSLAQLEVVIGDLEASQKDFQEVARMVADPIARGEAYHNVYRAALERRDWTTALSALRRAIALDADAYEPFPVTRFEPRQILGAGGFGVSFLCHDHQANRTVVVKALRTDALERDWSIIHGELRRVQALDNPALVRILESGEAGLEGDRPYLVFEHFEGAMTLAEFVARNGPIAPAAWLDIAWPLARALQAVHNRGVLHRNLRPGCILVRKIKNRDGEERLLFRVTDTALSLKRTVIHASASNPDAGLMSALGRTVARTVPFAPPEVIARPKGQVWIAPHSDVYNFGRLGLYALTSRPDPDNADRMLLGDGWNELLNECTSWTINRRIPHFGPIIDRLARLAGDDRLSKIDRDLNESSIARLTSVIEAEPTSAQAFLQRGNALAREGAFDKAILDYGRAIQLSPADASLYRRRAEAHSRSNNPDGAIADYSESLRLEPRNLEALANRGLAYSQKGEHDKAIADYSDGLKLAPHDEVLYFNRGNAWYMKGDLARAIDDYTMVIRIDSHHLWALGNRGKSLMMQGQSARALADFSRVLQLDPGNAKALFDRASAYAAIGRSDRAIADYTEAIRLGPTEILFFERGQVRLAAGEREGAIADFTEAINRGHTGVAVLHARARALNELDRPEESLADLTEVLRRFPDATSVLRDRGKVLVRLKRLEEAIADFTAMIQAEQEDEPDLYEGHLYRGRVHLEQGDLDRAIADFTEAIRLDSSNLDALHERGLAYAKLGEAERALRDFNQALETMRNNPVLLLARADMYVRLERHDEALSDFTAVLRLAPDTARAYADRGLILASRGELEMALEDFERAARLTPGDGRLAALRAGVLADLGRHDRALVLFQDALRANPEDVLTRFNRAVTLVEVGRSSEAVTEFDEVLSRQPDHARALLERGLARREQGNREAALADLSAAIAAKPEVPQAYFNRAVILAENGDPAAAIADLETVLQRDPDDQTARLFLGRLHLTAGDRAQALAAVEEACRRAPDDLRAINNLAWLLATDPARTERSVARALELAQRGSTGDTTAARLDTLAAALAANGRWAEAIETQRRAIALQDKEEFRVRLAEYEANAKQDAV